MFFMQYSSTILHISFLYLIFETPVFTVKKEGKGKKKGVGMVWRKYSIDTTVEAEEILAAYLMEEWGIEGVEFSDQLGITEEEAQSMFIDLYPEGDDSIEDATLSFYVEVLSKEEKERRKKEVEKAFSDPLVDHSYTLNSSNIFTEEECNEILRALKEELENMSSYCNIGKGSISQSETEDKDWMNAWKDFFHAFSVGNFFISPSWEEVPKEAEGKILLSVDPGTTFGTGQHETTKLCLLALEKYGRDKERVLDLGTGSGILGIAALKMGAKEVFATDLDPLCEAAVEENLLKNNLSKEQLPLFIGNILGQEKEEIAYRKSCEEKPFSLVLANILAPVIIALASEVPKFLKEGGIFISSGIIDEKAKEVRKSLEAVKEWEILEELQEGEWHAFVCKKK